jgi:hypothetical protein
LKRETYGKHRTSALNQNGSGPCQRGTTDPLFVKELSILSFFSTAKIRLKIFIIKHERTKKRAQKNQKID